MADDTEQKNSIPLPPKLDLRRNNPVKSVPAPVPSSGADSSGAARITTQDAVATVRLVPAPASVPAPAPAPAPSVVIRSQSAPTIEIKRPAVMPSSAPGVGVRPLVIAPSTLSAPVIEKKLASKSETSRIPLELATPAADAGPVREMKTIRVKPAGAAPAVVAPSVRVAPSAPVVAPKVEEKRKTSRISLESVLAMEDKSAPKTIRLKRPGDGTAKAAPTIDTIRAEPSTAGKPALGQTARLEEEPATEEDGPTPTRRKTIKVKRPTDRPGFRVAAGRAEGAGGGSPADGSGAEVALPAKATGFDWTAMVVAIFVIIMTFVICFMLASQAWGPNPSLTQLSNWTDGPDFGWTGKIPRAQ